ncbi:MAG: peptidase [Flavobacterium sp.]|nr:MAG: peptidase [Flavobacterium sp.]
MKKIICFLMLITASVNGQTKYQKDFQQFWSDYNDYYAYFDETKVDWNKVKEIYQPMADTVKSRDGFVKLLEKVINELHNGHISLNTNLDSSNRIIPSGEDLFVEKKENFYVISDVKANSPAEAAGLKPGMVISKFNGKRIDEQLSAFLPKSVSKYDDKMYAYAVNMLFAGTHDRAREISVAEKGSVKIFYPDKFKTEKPAALVDFRMLENNIGYIKVNNSLGHDDLIKEFDDALDKLFSADAIIFDLTDTPSGGNSATARAMMGRFISADMPYQKHVQYETSYHIKRSWIEYVSPHGKTYNKQLIVMVGHWTGSMGEGIAIGIDAMNRAKITGTKMAGLIGAIDGFKAPETNIGYQIPTEKLYHINGQPREDFVPEYFTKTSAETWTTALKLAAQR